MLRARHRNSNNNNNNHSDEEQENVLLYNRYTESSSVESNTTTETHSLTTSTTTLLGHQHQQQQQQHRRHRHHQQPLTGTSIEGPTGTSNTEEVTGAHYAFRLPWQATNKFKRPYPGVAVARHNAERKTAARAWQATQRTHDGRVWRVEESYNMHDYAGARHSIRRIRRPRQWTTLPGAVNDARVGDVDAGTLTGGNNGMATAFVDAEGACAEPKANMAEKGKAFIVEFLQGSSIHGFIYLAKMGLNFVERILWFAFICVALFAIMSLSKRTWERFQTSPTVISMDRNKLVWNTSFPSLTVCPHKRIDELKVEDYMILHSEQFTSEEDKEDFRDFIVKLASLSYENIETLPINKTFGIASEKYLDLLYELKWNFEPEISSGAAVQMYIYETLTEFGICHSVNSLVARYNSYDYWRSNDWSMLDHGDRVTVHPLDGEIYAQIINLSTAYDVYFHGAGDVPNISKQRYTFPESDYTTVELIALEIYTAEAARAFTTKQRKCRFQHEAEEMLTVPIYSFGLCLAECRMLFALKICGCVPHFYRNRLKNGRVLPICGFPGLSCLATIKRDLITLKSDKYKIDCNCLSNCDDSNFFVQSYRSRVWFLGANLQWGIIDYPKMQLRRDVLFSFADVLVYIGGLVGFFLGCSALSFTEIVYFFTARLIRRMFLD